MLIVTANLCLCPSSPHTFDLLPTFYDTHNAGRLLPVLRWSWLHLMLVVIKINSSENIVSRVTTPDQLDQYIRMVIMKNSLENPDGGELIVSCPNCKYYEYRKANSTDVMFIYCQNAECEQVS